MSENTTLEEPKKKDSSKTIKHVSIGILVTLLILMVIYIILMFEWFKNKKFVFAPYVVPAPPDGSNPFYPTGEIQDLTPEEICIRNLNIYCASDTNRITPSSFDPGIPNYDECFKQLGILPADCDGWGSLPAGYDTFPVPGPTS